MATAYSGTISTSHSSDTNIIRSLADQLSGKPEEHVEMRRQICEFMTRNKADFSPFIDEPEEEESKKKPTKLRSTRRSAAARNASVSSGQQAEAAQNSFDRYIKSMNEQGTFGGHLELVAFSRLFSKDIVIHQLDAPNYFIRSPSHRGQTVHLAYHDYEHYSSVGTKHQNMNTADTIKNDTSKNEDDAVTAINTQTQDTEPTSEEKMIMGSTGSNDLARIRKMLDSELYSSSEIIELLLQESLSAQCVIESDTNSSVVAGGTSEKNEKQHNPQRRMSAHQRKVQAKKTRKLQRKLKQKNNDNKSKSTLTERKVEAVEI